MRNSTCCKVNCFQPRSPAKGRLVEGNGSKQCKVKIKTKVKVDLVVSEQVVMLLNIFSVD